MIFIIFYVIYTIIREENYNFLKKIYLLVQWYLVDTQKIKNFQENK